MAMIRVRSGACKALAIFYALTNAEFGKALAATENPK